MINLANKRVKYLQDQKQNEERQKHDAHDKFKAYMLNNLDKIVDDCVQEMLLKNGTVTIVLCNDNDKYRYWLKKPVNNGEESTLFEKTIPNFQNFAWADGIRAQYEDLLITTYTHDNLREIHLTVAPHDAFRIANSYFESVGNESYFINDSFNRFINNNLSSSFSAIFTVFATSISCFVISVVGTLIGHSNTLASKFFLGFFLIASILGVMLSFWLSKEDKKYTKITNEISEEFSREVEHLRYFDHKKKIEN